MVTIRIKKKKNLVKKGFARLRNTTLMLKEIVCQKKGIYQVRNKNDLEL